MNNFDTSDDRQTQAEKRQWREEKRSISPQECQARSGVNCEICMVRNMCPILQKEEERIIKEIVIPKMYSIIEHFDKFLQAIQEAGGDIKYAREQIALLSKGEKGGNLHDACIHLITIL